MEATSSQVYGLTKLNLLLHFKGRDLGGSGAAYAYAWANDVYPALHEMTPWHQPFKKADDCFRVGEDQVMDLLRFLDQHWDNNETITFYELEDHYEVTYGKSGWDRVALIDACRYLFLGGRFDPDFWARIVKNGECPVEAHCVVDSFQQQELEIW